MAVPAPGTPIALQPASWMRRIGALLVDWIAATMVAYAILLLSDQVNATSTTWMPLVIFWLESSLGVAVAGGSFGQLVTGVRVLRTNGAVVSLLRSVLRQLLVCLVIPPLVFKPDGRGLHDLAVDSGAYVLSKPS